MYTCTCSCRTAVTCVHEPEAFVLLLAGAVKLDGDGVAEADEAVDATARAAQRLRAVPVAHLEPVAAAGALLRQSQVDDVETHVLARVRRANRHATVAVAGVVVGVVGRLDVAGLAGDLELVTADVVHLLLCNNDAQNV